jgi:hypothetical protein
MTFLEGHTTGPNYIKQYNSVSSNLLQENIPQHRAKPSKNEGRSLYTWTLCDWINNYFRELTNPCNQPRSPTCWEALTYNTTKMRQSWREPDLHLKFLLPQMFYLLHLQFQDSQPPVTNRKKQSWWTNFHCTPNFRVMFALYGTEYIFTPLYSILKP